MAADYLQGLPGQRFTAHNVNEVTANFPQSRRICREIENFVENFVEILGMRDQINPPGERGGNYGALRTRL